MTTTSRRSDLTFRHNIGQGRHGWLRLTPAYSIKVVQRLLAENDGARFVLDPFSGTGTTGLVCAENDVNCDLIDINPFLVWLARVKTVNYTRSTIAFAKSGGRAVVKRLADLEEMECWRPPIANIERWWSLPRVRLLSRLLECIKLEFSTNAQARDLAFLAFCRCAIDWSNAAFNHQSMSFKSAEATLFDEIDETILLTEFTNRLSTIVTSAELPLVGTACVREADSRSLLEPSIAPYDLVVTSPPYPNRMSYIRELRPYMYWLGYLSHAREAGELDWQAIGGTWGIATSRTEKWKANGVLVPHPGFDEIVAAIGVRSHVLANYVNKYFVDMTMHFESLFKVTAPGARIHYIVGNSKFYETLVDVEEIFASLIASAGFMNTTIEILRKRNSKKELVEFLVSASRP